MRAGVRCAVWCAVSFFVWSGLAFAQEGSEEGSVAREPMAPPPFSAEALREGIQAGEYWQYRIIEGDQPPVVETMRVVAVSEEGAQFASTYEVGEGGEPREPDTFEGTWAELEGHATWPAAQTRIEAMTLEVPAGAFEGVLYTVTGSDGSVIIAQFASALPGPPVLMTISVGDEHMFMMELLAHGESAEGEAPAE